MDIRTVGALLYWCEGSKRLEDRRVEFVNSDPRMIMVFLKYLRSLDVEEDRIKLRMALHSQDDETSCREYWKSITKLANSNFISTILKRSSTAKKHVPHGTMTVRYNSVNLLRIVSADVSRVVSELLLNPSQST